MSVAAIALAAPAFAADLPSRKAPIDYPPPPPMWTGFYIGLNAGYGWGMHNNASVSTGQAYDLFGSNSINSILGQTNSNSALNAIIDPQASLSAVSASGVGSIKDSGFLGGLTMGYNWQFGNSWVAGLEADIDGAGIRGNTHFGGSSAWNVWNATSKYGTYSFDRSAATSTSISKHTDWLGTLRGRVGWLVTPTMMIFGTGGLAYGGVEANVYQNQTIGNTLSYTSGKSSLAIGLPFAGATAGHYSDTRIGWAAGGGFEWLFLPAWSLKAEALYYDLGTAKFTNAPLVASGPTIAATGLALPFLGTINQGVTQVRYDGVIARVGLNYHFNGSGAAPVMAKY